MTQAAVSQQVRQLEDWLGAQLFKRLPRALALTDAGIAYLPIVQDGIERIDLGTTELVVIEPDPQAGQGVATAVQIGSKQTPGTPGA